MFEVQGRLDIIYCQNNTLRYILRDMSDMQALLYGLITSSDSSLSHIIPNIMKALH